MVKTAKTALGVATTILRQLGGVGRLTAMLGAHTFTGDVNALTFKIKAKALAGIKAVKVTLDPSDTYTVEFWNIRGCNVALVATHADVYAEDLIRCCETVTGLAFRL